MPGLYPAFIQPSKVRRLCYAIDRTSRLVATLPTDGMTDFEVTNGHINKMPPNLRQSNSTVDPATE
jgi:hypothetical protein